jgi:hypothetical protein
VVKENGTFLSVFRSAKLKNWEHHTDKQPEKCQTRKAQRNTIILLFFFILLLYLLLPDHNSSQPSKTKVKHILNSVHDSGILSMR